MNKLGIGMAVIVAAALASAGPVWSDSKEAKKQGKVEMANAAKVTIEQAIKAASDKAPGKVIEAELEHEHGKVVWKLKVVAADNKVVEVHVDADSGAVIDTEEKKPGKKK